MICEFIGLLASMLITLPTALAGQLIYDFFLHSLELSLLFSSSLLRCSSHASARIVPSCQSSETGSNLASLRRYSQETVSVSASDSYPMAHFHQSLPMELPAMPVPTYTSDEPLHNFVQTQSLEMTRHAHSVPD